MRTKIILLTIGLGISTCVNAQTSLIYFNVAQVIQYIDLTWGTPSEMNMDYYVIERSLDNISFTPVLTQQAVGNTSSNSSYVRTDSTFFLDTCYYYRIKAVEINGNYQYLDTVMECYQSGPNAIVERSNEINFALYPNPLSGNILNLLIEKVSPLTINVYDSYGKIIYSSSQTTNHFRLDCSAFSKGIYFIQILSNGEMVSTKKIIRE